MQNTGSDPENEALQQELRIAEAKRNVIFTRVQNIYTLSKSALNDESSSELFLSNAVNIDSLRSDFERGLDAFNTANLKANPRALPNYQPWISFEDMFCQIKRIYEKLSKPVASDSKQNVFSSFMDKPKPKLPAISLKSFDGDIKNWPIFYQQFKSVIHDNQNLSNADRVHYLVGQLTGSAKSICAGLAATEDNYPIIWEALKKKYDDTRLLATAYLNQILEFKPLSSNSCHNLDSFLNNFDSAVKALQQLKIDNLSDFILSHLALRRLDSETVRSFEHEYCKEKFPSYGKLVEFIFEQSKVMSRLSNKPVNSFQNKPVSKSAPIPKPVTKSFVNMDNKSALNCVMCKSTEHESLYKCPVFTKLNPRERFEYIRRNSFCNNCLSTKHKFVKCASLRKCSQCDLPHHTLLHFPRPVKSIDAANPTNKQLCFSQSVKPNDTAKPAIYNPNSPARKVEIALEASNASSSCNVTREPVHPADSISLTTLLGTAKIQINDNLGHPHVVRALIDPGSQQNYITADCCKRLSIPILTQSRFTCVQGIGGASQNLLGKANVKFTSHLENKVEYLIQPLVIQKITSKLPDAHVDTSALSYLNDLPLADDLYYEPGPIDLLLGVNIFNQILLFDKIVKSDNLPTALETSLGYVLMGDAPIHPLQSNSSKTFCAFSQDPLNQTLEKFWNLEEVPSRPFLSPDDQKCEEIFVSTTVRRDNGRYAVCLPFKDSPELLGNSYVTAKKRFLTLENKFNKNSKLREEYDKVINDYLEKDIVSLVPPEDLGSSDGFYIPHHPVLREDKITTKLRIVLDASAKTDTGCSLNDILHTGCNLQSEIFHILLNVRCFQIAFFADVRQMYLCIEVQPQHRTFQRFLYRFSSDDPIQTYWFNRVAFGLRSSPFLALRTLRQLAADEKDKYPLAASELLDRDAMYMDDLASSSSSLDEAVKTAQELIDLFKAGGFDLVKWTSNSSELLDRIPTTHRQTESISFDESDTHKILGLQWLPGSDTFIFSVSPPQPIGTKRAILSATARLYDVLGLVGPVILYSKLLIKELWLLKWKWDDEPPPHISSLWNRFISELPLIAKLHFPRHLGFKQTSEVTIMAFADASEKAYGCCIYAHVVNAGLAPVVHLICSKSRVAPVKTITVARLELCAIVLMSKLLRVTTDSLSKRHPIANIYAFSDSKVALCWVHSSPHRFNTFVANRISQCQSLLSPDHFYHVPGLQNPADCLSRGLLPSALINHELWFHGPPWASQPRSEWPISPFSEASDTMPEEKTVAHVIASSDEQEHPLLLMSLRFSNWNKFLKATVYFLRFTRKLPRNDIITASDLETAETTIIKIIQQSSFSEDMSNMSKGKPCSTSLRKLSPFFSNDQILRVGGRLRNSSLEFSQKHPALLPKCGHIIEMIIDWYHRENFHAGPQLLLSLLRQRFWILSARRIVRARIHKCNLCFRLNPRPTFPVMADLPECRLEQCKAFTHTGVDYAGPLYVTFTRKRGVRSQKAYLCLFICLVTKAVHLELASDLSSSTFLEAFKRFLSRRGPVKFLYSDNGTNFIASKAYLSELHDFLKNDEYYKSFSNELAKHRIIWRLNPPNAPHFGGIWESNIKVIKLHLFRSLGKQILSYEEMLTVLTQIEAIANSRPLYLQSSDPSELSALTPSHFLGTSDFEFLPAPNLSNERENLLSRFLLMDSLIQSFWKRFRTEYLHSLQTREKWNTPARPVSVGDVVLVDVNNTPPLQWPLGVIIRLFPGKDGVVRVAEIRMKNGIFQRPVIRLCPLPSQ